MKSVRAYLLALVMTCMLLAIAGFSVLLFQAYGSARRDAEMQVRETSQTLSLAVDAEVERATSVVRTLAASNDVRNRDWAAVDRAARAAYGENDAWVLVQDREGQQLVNTRLPRGAKLPRATPPAGMWQALDRRQRHVCDLSEGVVERRIVCVDVPERFEQPAKYALSVIFRPRFFQSVVRRQNVDSGQLASLVDTHQRVIWRNIRPDKFIGQRVHGPLLPRLLSGSPSGSLESVSLENVPMLTGYQRSPVSGWTVIAAVPLSTISVTAALLHGTLLALLIVLIGCFLAVLFWRRLVQGLASLTPLMESDADHQGAEPIGLAEFDAAAGALRRSAEARSRSERNQQMLIGELNHRVKNTLAVVQSLAHQTFRGNRDPAESIGAFEARLQALGRAHNLLTRESWRSAPLAEIVREALAPFCGPGRCDIDGPEVTVPPQVAVSLALALHELATNAVKYGALSSAEGRVVVRWQAAGDRFQLRWEEKDGPKVTPPTRQGFGTRLIQRSLAAELKGKVTLDFAPEGLRCEVRGSIVPPSAPDVLAVLAEQDA